MFCDWAFLKHRGDAIDEIWKKIPKDIDILVTHGPPLGKSTKSNNCLTVIWLSHSFHLSPSFFHQ